MELPWWRMVGAAPTPARGALPPGAALVQAFTVEGSNGCPSTGLDGASDTLNVTVEGVVHPVSLPAATVHEMTTCDMASALPSTIALRDM